MDVDTAADAAGCRAVPPFPRRDDRHARRHRPAESAPDLLDFWTTAVRETRAASNTARALRIGFVASAANEATQDIIAA
jgi:hypothetical protein